MKTLLICTVGGSHQPILKAIEAAQPDFVTFICTGPDPETGQPGSEKQITGKGRVIKEAWDKPESLPNIPTLANLRADQFSLCLVPSDDIDAAFDRISSALNRLHTQFPEAQMIADYTGGTKSMTAALVIAVLETDTIELQLVTGARANLRKVENHSEYAVNASVNAVRLNRNMQPYLQAWRRYAYDEAADGLAKIRAPRDALLRSELNRACNLSRALAAWDRFDHAAALALLTPYRAKIGKSLGLQLKALNMLNEESATRREPLQLIDLWLNAQRRAAQGRYDDAVARVYRLIEWTAQWQLRLHLGIETADIPEDKIPEGIQLSKNREGKYQAGLFQSWQLLGSLLNNPAAEFIKTNDKTMLNHLLIRNRSILAHGFSPIGKEQWETMSDWMRQAFMPMLTELANKDADIRFSIERLQLPMDYSAIELN